jgi:hypothetical protein
MIKIFALKVKTLKFQYILKKRKNHQMLHFILQRRCTSSTKDWPKDKERKISTRYSYNATSPRKLVPPYFSHIP